LVRQINVGKVCHKKLCAFSVTIWASTICFTHGDEIDCFVAGECIKSLSINEWEAYDQQVCENVP